jgi:outer membrane receptor for ferrienterochelin and colicin
VLDGATMKPIAKAAIKILGASQTVVSDSEGGFRIDFPPGAITVDVTADGYDIEEQAIALPEAGSSEVVIVMFKQGTLGEQIKVFDRPPLLKTTPGQTEMTREELTTVPGARADALTVLRNLPGVANVDPFTPGQFVAGLILRGMAAEDSMYFVNGIELPILYHFFGVQSILPSEMIDSIEFIPGGFDVQYGRSTGGIINIHVRPSRADQWTGSAELSFINAGGFIEGPLSRKHHLKLTAGFRRSLVDVLLPLALSDSDHVTFTTSPQYYDAQLRLDWSPADHDDLSLIAFTGWDFAAAGIGTENALDPNASGAFSNQIGFTRAALSWHHHETDLEVFARAWIGDVRYKFNLGTALFQNGNGPIYGGRADVGYRLVPSLKLRAGGEFQLYHIQADGQFPLPAMEGQPASPNSTTQPQVVLDHATPKVDTAAAYAAADIDIGSRVTVTPGVRFDRYITIARQTVSPRATVSVKLSSEWTARATVGRYTRPPNGVEALDTKLDAEQATHYVAGAEYQPAEGVTATTCVFYNDLSNMVSYDPSLAMTSPLEGYTNRGTGRTFGIESMLRVQRENWFGWVTYTLSRSERRDAPGQPMRLFDYDQPGNLVVALSRKVGRWRFGARFQATSGEPATPLIGSTYNSDLDVYQPQYGQANSVRKEAAHQLDLRVDREWKFDDWRLSAYLDVSNVYNHLRATNYNYDFNYGQRTAITTFPIFPALGARGTF